MHNWADLDGYAVAQNMPDLRTLPIDRFCNFVWHMLTRNADESDRRKLEANIWRPPPKTVHIDPRSPWSAQNETSALGALKAGLGLSGKVPSQPAPS